jgi:N-acetyl sugar amidotransferase
MDMHYQVCTKCVMDTSAMGINFDDDGVCNYCKEFLERSSYVLNKDQQSQISELHGFIKKVKADGKNKRYDCIIGVSGGVDSSWVLVQAVKLGLRPLAVHMDNGWNSELAQNNISNLVQNLKVDLYTHVIDWNEYRKLMQAFFDADVIDVELLYDNAMLAVNYEQAKKYGIKFILAGTNQSTEGMSMPPGWNWLKYDLKNIKSIARKFGDFKFKTYPGIGTLGFIWYRFFHKIEWVSFLDFFSYNKAVALDILQREYDYKPYPYKHYESIFTRFYQAYILPQKFSIDKRRLHLSTLVVTGQMNREDAIQQLEKIPYSSEREMNDDKNYFIKKMGWNSQVLQDYINSPEISHATYGSEKDTWDFCFKIYKKMLSKAKI